MLVPRKISRKKIIILIFVIVIVLGFIIYLLINNFLVREISLPSTEIKTGLLMRPRMETRFETDFLRQQPYIRLKEHIKLPVQVQAGEIGRKNPFAKINFLSEF